ncbi:hypothetical protein A0H81_08137 [Grifola frondosa]|uniref:Uncharacterized protein n=1 Tax=Grifola frondosa TaxID=5627 RepID=A0A1C7M6F2_GRIFR|nr:hypothetical protein A0H81_08137 [Grifola frondosa]
MPAHASCRQCDLVASRKARLHTYAHGEQNIGIQLVINNEMCIMFAQKQYSGNSPCISSGIERLMSLITGRIYHFRVCKEDVMLVPMDGRTVRYNGAFAPALYSTVANSDLVGRDLQTSAEGAFTEPSRMNLSATETFSDNIMFAYAKKVSKDRWQSRLNLLRSRSRVTLSQFRSRLDGHYHSRSSPLLVILLISDVVMISHHISRQNLLSGLCMVFQCTPTLHAPGFGFAFELVTQSAALLAIIDF